MRQTLCVLLGGGLIAALAVNFLPLPGAPGQEQRPDPNPPVKKGKKVKNAKHQADEEAIRKQSVAFIQALEKGDAQAVAGFWTEEGEYIDDEGATYRGRAAIAKAYAQFLAKSPKVKIKVHIESIRFVSKDTAVEEGYARARRGKSESSSRYSVLHVRENGTWLMALVREWPQEGDDLRDLDWLIGTWSSRDPNGEVRSTYTWDTSKKFIRARFTIKGKDFAFTGSKMIAKDPRSGQIRSWLFESEGGFGEGGWTRDGKRWIVEATGVQADGTEMTATNIVTPISRDTFTWQSTNRTVNGEEVPDSPPIKITRVKVND
jgi:uncharacterized protein (TIGR02246 family)